MLPVSIESDNELAAPMSQRIGDAGLKRCTLAEVHRMLHEKGTRFACSNCGTIEGAVVYADDMCEIRQQTADNLANDCGLVIERDDHPGALIRGTWRGRVERHDSIVSGVCSGAVSSRDGWAAMRGLRQVIIASRVYPPEVAAASFRMQMLAEALETDTAVTVLTSRAPSAPANASSDSSIVVRRAPVLRDRTGAIRGYVQYLSFDFPLFFRLLVRRSSVIIAEAPPTTGIVALVVATLTRRRLIYYPGDIWTDAVKSMGASSVVVAVMRWLESRVLRGADRALAVSPEVAERLVELGARSEKVVLVGNGIDTRVFRPEVLPILPGTRYFVYTGTMSEWQEPSIFIRALAELSDTEVELRFFGQGAAEAELRTLADELVPGRVYFGGVVPPEESARWIRGAVGALVSIVPGIGYDFARPTKTYAAAACGTPVLFAGASTGGAVVREGGLGEAADFTMDAVRRAMERLLLDHESGVTESMRTQRAEWVRRNASLEAAGARAADAVRALVQGTETSA